MPKRSWSVARLMAFVLLVALSFAAVLALAPRPGMVVMGVVVLAVILALAADRAIFGRRRTFWLWFAAVGWLYIAVVSTYHWEIFNYFLDHGLSWFVAGYHPERNRMVFEAESGFRPMSLAERDRALWADSALRLAAGLLIATAGGLLGVALHRVGRRAGRAWNHAGLPDPPLRPFRPATTGDRHP